MSIYRRIRLWIDTKVGEGTGFDRILVVIGVAPMFLVPVIGPWWWIPSSVFLAGWVAFIAWRAWWIFKTGLIDADETDWIEPKG